MCKLSPSHIDRGANSAGKEKAHLKQYPDDQTARDHHSIYLAQTAELCARILALDKAVTAR